MLHSGVPQGVDHLLRGHQRRVLAGQRRAAGGAQGGVHAEKGQVLLKVLQLGIDELIPPPFCLIHIVQLV